MVGAEPGQRGVELATSGPGARCRRPARRGRRDPGLGADHDVLAGDASRSEAAEHLLGRPAAVPWAVSSRVPPASRKAASWSRGLVLVGSRPHVIVPRPSRETAQAGPAETRCCTCHATLAGRRRRTGPRPPRRGQSLGVRPCDSDSTSATGAPASDADNLALAARGRPARLRVAWVAEAYGSDARPCWPGSAAQTEQIDVGTAVLQIPGAHPGDDRDDRRDPGHAVAAAGSASASACPGPQVSEGLARRPFDDPLGRTREYVDIVRMALRRKTVEYAGEHFTLPLPDGPGKALKLTVHPVRDHDPDLPRRGRAEEPRADRRDRRRLAGDLLQPGALRRPPGPRARPGGGAAGRARRTTRWPVSTSCPRCPSSSTTTSSAAADAVRAYAALYIGGMGVAGAELLQPARVRMGYEEAAREVQDLFLDRKHRDAAMAVPLSSSTRPR